MNPFASLVTKHVLQAARVVEKNPDALLKALGFPVTPDNARALRDLCNKAIEGKGSLPQRQLSTLKELISRAN